MDNLPQVEIGGLKPYPPSMPADINVQEALHKLWQANHSFIVLSGPPGVGKTRASEDYILQKINESNSSHSVDECRVTNLFPNYRTKNYSTAEILETLKEKRISFAWDLAVLHPQYTYEDIIRGYRMAKTSDASLQLEVREGVLGFVAKVIALLERISDSDYQGKRPLGVLVLDEINRAPIGQLFGEAIYALDRRGEIVETPYDLEGYGSQFTVPKSLLILGTMNSVDRAVSGFDFAMRRRFSTITMSSSVTSIEKRYDQNTLIKTTATELYGLVRKLIQSSTKTGLVPLSELIVGHSYFLAPKNILGYENLLEWLAVSYQYQILPILVDYQEQGLVEYDSDTIDRLPGAEVLREKVSIGDFKVDAIIDFLTKLSKTANSA